MKTPPFLLAAALLFWGWQSDYLLAGALLAVLLEGSRVIKARWDFSDEDFGRIWTFCTLLFLGLAVYAFTDNGGPENFRLFFQEPSRLSAQRQASNASAQTAASLIRWLPMIFFLFVAAQAYSSREEIPLRTISLILQRRWKKAKKTGQNLPAGHGMNVGYPYFIICMFAASVHRGQDLSFFYGSCVLMIWALWPFRSRRFHLPVWLAAFAVVLAIGYFGQRSINQFQHYLENMNPQWMARFLRRGSDVDPTQSKTAIGQIGNLKLSDEIVIRVESKYGRPPNYLREATYRKFTSPYWYAAQSKTDFGSVLPEADELTWILQRGKTNNAAITIASFIPRGNGLLPLPETIGELQDLPAYVLAKNSAGAVLADGPGLVIFDALYGPGQMIDSPPNSNDLQVAEREIPALEQVLAEIQLSRGNTNEAIRRLSGFFESKFTYRTWQDADKLISKTQTPLARFLLQTRAGHCEYFATATVLLLREVGIPARYAVGYALHEVSGKGFVVRQRDAHAWCLVWNASKQTWEDFDTTPAIWVNEETKRDPFQWLRDGWSWIKFQIAKLRWNQGHLRQYILISLVPVLVLLFVQIIRKRKRHRPDKDPMKQPLVWPGLDSEFYQIEKQLAEGGVERQPNEPLGDWLERAAQDAQLTPLRQPLRELLRLHYRYRFDPRGLSHEDRDLLQKEAKQCLEKLTHAQESEPDIRK